MKHLKTFNENNNISIFGEEWKKLLPKKIGIITSNGKFELVNSTGEKTTPGEKPDIIVSGVGDEINISYYQKTFTGPNDVLKDGEPDSLSIDLYLTKHKNGIKILVDIIYGEAPMFEFSIEPPNKIIVSHYNGIGSLYDPKYLFALTDESIGELVKFFNSFNNGLNLTSKEFAFLDEDEDSYKFNNELPGQDEESLKNSLKKESNLLYLTKFKSFDRIEEGKITQFFLYYQITKY